MSWGIMGFVPKVEAIADERGVSFSEALEIKLAEPLTPSEPERPQGAPKTNVIQFRPRGL